MKWKDRKEELSKYINEEKLSYEEIGRKYGISGSAIRKAAKNIGIELTPRRKLNPKEHFNKGTGKKKHCLNCGKELVTYKTYKCKYCNNKCQSEYEHKERYKLIIDGDESIMRGNYSPQTFKEDILQEQNGICAICGCKTEWNGKPLVFIIDHIDGNAANNKRDNLRVICPNCDSQLPTYKSKNKNSARNYYRYPKNKEE